MKLLYWVKRGLVSTRYGLLGLVFTVYKPLCGRAMVALGPTRVATTCGAAGLLPAGAVAEARPPAAAVVPPVVVVVWGVPAGGVPWLLGAPAPGIAEPACVPVAAVASLLAVLAAGAVPVSTLPR